MIHFVSPFLFLSLLSDSTNDPEITNHVLWPTELKRRVGKLTISRRYNQLPLLRSSPGGFEGSWPYRTYPFSFCGCKVDIILESAIACGGFFICFFDSFFMAFLYRHFGGEVLILRSTMDIIESIRPTYVTLSSDGCSVIVDSCRTIIQQPSERILLSIPESKV